MDLRYTDEEQAFHEELRACSPASCPRSHRSFQAVEHMLADMLTAAEVARAAVYAAACAVNGASTDDPERASAVAKVVAGDAALRCGRSAFRNTFGA